MSMSMWYYFEIRPRGTSGAFSGKRADFAGVGVALRLSKVRSGRNRSSFVWIPASDTDGLFTANLHVHTYFMGCLEFCAIMPAVRAHNAAPLRDYISGVICLVGPT